MLSERLPIERKEASAKGHVVLSTCSVKTDFRLVGIVLSNSTANEPVEPQTDIRYFILHAVIREVVRHVECCSALE